MRAQLSRALALGLCLALGSAAWALPPRPGPRRGIDTPERDAPARRRGPEAAAGVSGTTPDPNESPLTIDLTRDVLPRDFWRRPRDACQQAGWTSVRARLLALENDSELMSLELWGDLEAYGPGARVLFQMRSQRGAYVTLWWLGPGGQLVVPIENVRIPGERNVSIDTGGVIVPPFGNEQWVAIATLEPIPLGCASEAMMLGAIARRLAGPHAIGRWQVRSEARPTKRPR